jgi:hypothetical protein
VTQVTILHDSAINDIDNVTFAGPAEVERKQRTACIWITKIKFANRLELESVSAQASWYRNGLHIEIPQGLPMVKHIIRSSFKSRRLGNFTLNSDHIELS